MDETTFYLYFFCFEALNIEYFKFLTKNLKSLLEKRYCDALIFQVHESFDYHKYNFKISWPQKIFAFKNLFDTIITLSLMIEKGS